MREYTIEKLAAQLKNKKDAGKKAVLFLGAGVSVTAGIPLSDKIMDEIDADENLREIVQGTERKYGKYFAQLDQSQAKSIFDKHIKNSKINLAHLYACHLVKDGYVDCILTTNFDPLIIRTLSIYGINPTIYDLTVSRDNISSDLSYPAVVYLHGQNNGFWRLNSTSDFDIAKGSIGKTLQKVIINRPLIIVGYSGNNDPVFEQLSEIDSYSDGLYWVTYKDNEPIENVKVKLLDMHTKGAMCIRGFDADQFFRNLRNKLNKDLPDILNKPFTHLKGLIENISEIKLDDDKPWEALVQVKESIDIAISKFERISGKFKLAEKDLLKLLNDILINNNFQELERLDTESFEKILETNMPELIKAASSVFNNWGVNLGDVSKSKTGEEQEELYKSAFKKFEKAIIVQADMYEPYFNWGIYLGNYAETKTGVERDNLYKLTFEKFDKAVAIRPDKYRAFSLWGIYLGDYAKTKFGEEQEKYYKSAFEKFEKAISLKPNLKDAFYNWGLCLSELADIKTGEEQEKLYRTAIDKYEKVIEINPDDYDAYNNWGIAHTRIAERASKKEKESEYKLAFEKYKLAVSVNSKYYDAYYNWGTSLANLGDLKVGSEKEQLYRMAKEKFEIANEIKPDSIVNITNWGICLGKLAALKLGSEKDELIDKANKKFEKALTIDPKSHHVFYNWSCLYALQNRIDESIKYLKKANSLDNNTQYTQSFILEDEDFKSIKDDPKFVAFLEETFMK